MVRIRNNQQPPAKNIALRAVNPRPIGGIVRDPLVVLLVLGVPEENGAGDLLLHVATAEVGESGGDEGRTLAKSPLRQWPFSRLACSRRAYLYPPVTTAAEGHFVLAILNRRVASSIDRCVVPSGSMFGRYFAL